MEYLKYFFITTILCLYSSVVSGQVQVVIDQKAIGIVSANMAFQLGLENEHNATLDSIKESQTKLAEHTASISAMRTGLKSTMENIKGFGAESKYYNRIALISGQIVSESVEILNNISHSGLAGNALFLVKITDLVERTSELVSHFVNIVNNGKVVNPFDKSAPKKGDGYNLLDRKARLGLVITILNDLQEVRFKLRHLKFLLMYGTIHDLAISLDLKGYLMLIGGKSTAESLIYRWNNFR